MNAVSRIASVETRVADLADPQICRAIEDFVRLQPESTPFHLPGWSRAVERACGARAHYLTAARGREIMAVLPLHEVRSPLFGNALVSVAFAVGGGQLGDAPGLADAALRLAEKSGCPTVELRGGVLPERGWVIDDETYVGFRQPLAEEDEAQLIAIPRKQRAEVRRALGFDLDVTVGVGPTDIDHHYRVYAESVRNLGTPVFPKRLFTEVLAAFGDEADILTVHHKGQPLASVLSLYHKGVVMPYWGGGVAGARSWRANDLMYYALMCHARRDKGCHSFDFGRSKVGTGPAAFKKNFGFAPETLRYVKRSVDGQPLRNVNPLSPKYRLQVSLWQKLPLPVANRIGPWISRGLG
ncbi:FemAB family PEP-CTERM system-associated protein [Chakrabartia godavariana]|nr:FemAB family PEP-CTERM system-associated protein [Chakrabartia godavariana]